MMGDKTGIEWTDATWDPVTGCTKVSQGCKHCYAERMWGRLSAPGMPYAGREFTDVQTHPDRLEQPLRWQRPRRVFVNSMSDLFHEAVPDEFIDEVFAIMGACDDADRGHTFQVLTKRPERMLRYMTTRAHAAWNSRRMAPSAFPPRNVWLGVSVEDQDTAEERIPLLLQTPAAVRWISAEPLLGRVDLCEQLGMWWNQTMQSFEATGSHINRSVNGRGRIDWVVVGGESGPHARPMHPDWARSLRDQCVAAGVAFLFKQHGEWIGVPDLRRLDGGSGPGFGAFDHCAFDPDHEAVRVGKKAAGRLLDGELWDQYPA